MENIFVQLKEMVESLGCGFPDIPESVLYLKKVFTEQQARTFLAMEDKYQPVEAVAKRLGQRPEIVKPVLDEMADKGLVMTTTNIEPTFYAPLPWLTGWGDWCAYYTDKELADLDGALKESFKRGIPKQWSRNCFRTVPIHETLPDKSTVAPYDDIVKVLQNAGTISVAKCYCDLWREKRGDEQSLHEMREPLERCFLFGTWAEYLIEKGYGRKVSVEEGMEILNKCRDAGLIQNVTDLMKPIFICNCGPDCGSNMFRSIVPSPFQDYVQTNNYYAEANADLCTGCGDCVERCNLRAITMGEGGTAQVREETCVGCGQCVYHCQFEAISLKKRPEHYVPVTVHPCDRSTEEYMADLEPYKEIIKPRQP